MNSRVAQFNTQSPMLDNTAPRILIVDDEQHMCDVCSRTLQRGGYEVLATNDPQVAIQALRGEQSFDLLLTDIRMPTMSGLDLAQIAREQDPAIAIVIMTGYASMENLHEAVQRGAADFLSKPFELEHLRLAVDQALHKRAILQDNLRLRVFEQLLNSSKSMSSTLELQELATILLQVVLQQSGCKAAFLFLVDDESLLTLVKPSVPEAELLCAGQDLAVLAVDTQQPLYEHNYVYAQLNDIELRYGYAAPLRAQGHVNGLVLLCDDQPRMARPVVQQGIMLLANHAGSALRNAHLYSRLDDAYQRLQELDRLKREFIAVASHELRTPLAIVLGYTMMVRDQLEGEQREYLHRVMDSGQRIKELVDDMVSLRHIEIGEEHLVLEPVVMQDLINQALEGLKQGLLNNQYQIAAELPEQPMAFLCDREKIQLILGHLLSNAMKYTPEGGRICFRIWLHTGDTINHGGSSMSIPSSLIGEHPWVVVSIEDTGIGIPEREQARIFERFYQVADSLTRERGGIGLGLALVRELVEVLGGIVWVSSQEQQGSTFTFALPYKQALS